MDEIVASVERVTDIMAEITAASQEQSAGIEQVNQAITQMDQVTQQNAALVEEAAAAAESMQEQAARLARSGQHLQAGRCRRVPAPPTSGKRPGRYAPGAGRSLTSRCGKLAAGLAWPAAVEALIK